MAGIKNKYDFYKGFLEALGAEGINETDYKNEEELRKKILDALGVEYVFDDVNQTDLFREKFLQGISSGGGGGSSDFSTAEVEFHNTTTNSMTLNIPFISNNTLQAFSFLTATKYETLNVVLYKGSYQIENTFDVGSITVTGDIIVDDEDGLIIINGAGTITFLPA